MHEHRLYTYNPCLTAHKALNYFCNGGPNMKRSFILLSAVALTALLASCSPGVAPESSSSSGGSEGSATTSLTTEESSTSRPSEGESTSGESSASSEGEHDSSETGPVESSESTSPDQSSSEQGLEKYKVSENLWTENITRGGYFGVNNNLTFNIVAVQDNGSTETVLIENENGKLHLKAAGGESEFNTYTAPKQDGTYDMYVQSSDGKWTKVNVSAAVATQYMGFVGTFIHPWAFTEFTFNGDLHAYVKASDVWVMEDDEGTVEVRVTDIVIKFEDQKLISMSYKASAPTGGGSVNITTEKWGTTEVTLPEVAPGVDVTKIEFVDKALTLKVGESKSLSMIFEPADATPSMPTFNSSNENVVIVNEYGIVTAVAEGKATITATLGKLIATCEITVVAESQEDDIGYSEDPKYTKEWLENFLSTITVSFFDDGEIDDDGNITGASFEMYSTSADGRINYAFLGHFDSEVSDSYVYSEVILETYFNGKAGKYYHGDHINDYGQEVFVLGDYMYFDYLPSTESFKAEGYITTSKGAGSSVSFKGGIEFEAVNDSPSRLDNLPEDPHDDNYEQLVENKLFNFKELTRLEGGDDNLALRYQQGYANSAISLFEEGYGEAKFAMVPESGKIEQNEFVVRGSYSIEPTAASDKYYGEDIYAIDFNGEDQVINGASGDTTFAKRFYLDAKKNELFFEVTEVYTDGMGSVKSMTSKMVFGLAEGVTPTKYVIPDAPDAWDSKLVAETLAAFGFTDPLPKLGNVKLFDLKTDGPESGRFEIQGLMYDGEKKAMTVYNEYPYSLYELGFTQEFDDQNRIVYISPNKQYSLYTNFNTDNLSFHMAINKNEVPYPSVDIYNYLVANHMNDTVIDFKTDSAADYTFIDGSLVIALKSGADASAIASAFKADLLKKNYKVRKIDFLGKEFLISPTSLLAIEIVVGDGFITVQFINNGDLPNAYYPDSKINKYLTGVKKDKLPVLSDTNVQAYIFEEPEGDDPFQFVAYLPDNVSGYDLSNSIAFNQIGKNGYTKHNISMVRGGEIVSTADDVFVSANREIAIYITGDDKYQSSPSYYLVRIYNLTVYDQILFEGETIEVEPTITGLRIDGYKNVYSVGEQFAFDGNVYLVYDDESETLLAADQYSVNPADTSSVGEKTFTITYMVGEGNFFTVDGTIEVVEPEPEVIQFEYSVEDDYRWLTYKGATFKVWAWGGHYEEGAWVDVQLTESKLFVFNAWNDADGFIIVRFKASVANLEEFPKDWDSSLNEYVLNESGNLLDIEVAEGGAATFRFDENSPVFVNYDLRDNNDWDVLDSGAVFKVWAWGGEYGEGEWLDVNVQGNDRHRRAEFTFEAFSNAEGLKIVRLNPSITELEEFPSTWDATVNSYVWNETGNLLENVDGSGQMNTLFTF